MSCFVHCQDELYYHREMDMNATICCAGDGRCVICDSFVKPATLVRVCDECNYGSYAGRCVVCGGIGVADAYYCKECTSLEKDVRSLMCQRTWFCAAAFILCISSITC